MAVIYPCKDCEECHIGCHSECEKYKECTDKTRQINSKHFEDGCKHGDIVRAMQRMKKRRGLK